MNIRDLYITIFCAMFAAPLVIFSLNSATAEVMQSTSYKIQTDSLNFGGGISTSSSYSLESTAGEVATGDSSSTNFNLRAGYQQMTGSFIALSAPVDVIMSPSLPGVTGGISNGSTTVTVTTDSPAGYSLTIQAESSPAMVSGINTIADYIPAGANPDFNFTTGSTDSHFGFSVNGIDIVGKFLNVGGICNSGSSDEFLKCWDGLSTGDQIIAQSASANSPSGATTTIEFRVGLGNAIVQSEGLYTATTTLTALPL
jgi:hypothetical protein